MRFVITVSVPPNESAESARGIAASRSSRERRIELFVERPATFFNDRRLSSRENVQGNSIAAIRSVIIANGLMERSALEFGERILRFHRMLIRRLMYLVAR